MGGGIYNAAGEFRRLGYCAFVKHCDGRPGRQGRSGGDGHGGDGGCRHRFPVAQMEGKAGSHQGATAGRAERPTVVDYSTSAPVAPGVDRHLRA